MGTILMGWLSEVGGAVGRRPDLTLQEGTEVPTAAAGGTPCAPRQLCPPRHPAYPPATVAADWLGKKCRRSSAMSLAVV